MIIDRAIQLNKKLKDEVASLPGVVVGDFEGFKADPMKTVLKIRGLSGHELADILDAMRINIEKSTQKCIVITTHVNITEEDVEQLITAITAIAREYGLESTVDEGVEGAECQ